MAYTVDKCLRCGKLVIKNLPDDSSDMVQGEINLQYLCDPVSDDPDSALSRRPWLQFKGEFCIDCLVVQIREWAENLKAIAKSDIPTGNVIFGDGATLTPSGRKRKVAPIPTARQSTIDEQIARVSGGGTYTGEHHDRDYPQY